MVARESGMMPTPTAPYLQIFLTSDFLPKNCLVQFSANFQLISLTFQLTLDESIWFLMFLGGFLMIFSQPLQLLWENGCFSHRDPGKFLGGTEAVGSHPVIQPAGPATRRPTPRFTRVNRPWAKLIVCRKLTALIWRFNDHTMITRWSHDDHTVSICFVFFFVKTRSFFSNPQEICSAVLYESGALYSLNKIVNAQLRPCSDAAIIRKTSCGRSSHYSDRSLQQNSTQKEVGLALMW